MLDSGAIESAQQHHPLDGREEISGWARVRRDAFIFQPAEVPLPGNWRRHAGFNRLHAWTLNTAHW